MLNQVVLVGRLTNDLEKLDENKSIITLAVSRSFKDENGEYGVDLVNCILWQGIAEKTMEYCHKGDIVGIKGRIQSDENKVIQIIAEKVSFLSSKAKDE